MLKKRLALNLGANLFAQIATVISQLGTVPMFFYFWGKESYGIWLTLSSIPAYLSLGEAGFATLAGNEMSMAVAGGNYEKARESLHTTWGFLLAISTVLLVLVAGVFLFFPWNHFKKHSGMATDNLRYVFALLCLYTIMGICISIFEAIYRTIYRNPRYQTINTSGRLVEIGVTCISVASSHSMIVLAGAMTTVRLLTYLVLWTDSRRFSPNLHLGLTAFSKVELKRAWRPATMFMAGTLGNAFYFQGLTLLVAGSLGPVAVAVFNTTRTLTRSLVQFVTMIKWSVRTEFSYLFGGGDLVRARKLNELAFEVSGGASIFFAAAIFIAAPFVIPLWTHHQVAANPLLLAIFLASAVLNGIWSVTSGLLLGINQHEGLMLRYLLAASLAVGLAAASIHTMGLYGVALSMVVCELILVPYAITRTCHLLRQSVKDFLCAAIQLQAVRLTTADYYRRWQTRTG